MTTVTMREKAKREIASILDHPSVFMGGPSQHNLRRADRILKHLLERYGIGLDDGEQSS